MIAQSSGDMCHKRLGAHTHAIRSVTNYPLFLGKHFKMVLAPMLSQSTKERKSLVFEKGILWLHQLVDSGIRTESEDFWLSFLLSWPFENGDFSSTIGHFDSDEGTIINCLHWSHYDAAIIHGMTVPQKQRRYPLDIQNSVTVTRMLAKRFKFESYRIFRIVQLSLSSECFQLDFDSKFLSIFTDLYHRF